MPTFSSWLNHLERWFGLVWRCAIHRGCRDSVTDLRRQIERFAAAWNQHSKSLSVDRNCRINPREARRPWQRYQWDTKPEPLLLNRVNVIFDGRQFGIRKAAVAQRDARTANRLYTARQGFLQCRRRGYTFKYALSGDLSGPLSLSF